MSAAARAAGQSSAYVSLDLWDINQYRRDGERSQALIGGGRHGQVYRYSLAGYAPDDPNKPLYVSRLSSLLNYYGYLTLTSGN